MKPEFIERTRNLKFALDSLAEDLDAVGDPAGEVLTNLSAVLNRLVYPCTPIGPVKRSIKKLLGWLCQEKKK